jgi:hypothetical protein
MIPSRDNVIRAIITGNVFFIFAKIPVKVNGKMLKSTVAPF